MKMPIIETEIYPVYSISEYSGDHEIEITEEENEWIRRVFREYEEVQKFLEDKYEEIDSKRRLLGKCKDHQ